MRYLCDFKNPHEWLMSMNFEEDCVAVEKAGHACLNMVHCKHFGILKFTFSIALCQQNTHIYMCERYSVLPYKIDAGLDGLANCRLVEGF